MVRLLLIVAFAVGTFVIALPSTSEAQDLSVAEQQYVGRSLTLFAMTVASFERVNDLTADPRMLESDWQNDFIGETSVWKVIYQESMEVHVPVRFKEANDKAITAYKAAVNLKPDDAEAHLRLAVLYLELGNRDAADAEYNTIKELNPQLAGKLYERMSQKLSGEK